MDLAEFQDALQRLSPREFEEFVLEVLRATGTFQDLLPTTPAWDGGVDIIGTEAVGGRARKLLVVVKRRRLVSADVARYIVGLAAGAIAPGDDTRLMLVVSGAVTSEARLILHRQGVLLVDPATLLDMTPPDLASRYLRRSDESDSPSKPTVETPSKETSLAAALTNLPAGLGSWGEYQRLIAEILEFLFCPPLDPPRYEFADADRRNRRDVIFENGAPDGFWSHVRLAYEAHYIVVDAKNYGAPLKKAPVLDIAHYLKPYGCGMFSLLVSRQGLGAAAAHAIREQWIGSKKLIVGIDDAAVGRMLTAKAEGGRPEEIIRKIIADFRMAL